MTVLNVQGLDVLALHQLDGSVVATIDAPPPQGSEEASQDLDLAETAFQAFVLRRCKISRIFKQNLILDKLIIMNIQEIQSLRSFFEHFHIQIFGTLII